MRPDRLDVLRTGLVRFTQPKHFNDPFEGAPAVTGFLPPGGEAAFARMMREHIEAHPEQLARDFQEGVDDIERQSGMNLDFLRRLSPAQLMQMADYGIADVTKLIRDRYDAQVRETLPKRLRNQLNASIGILSLSAKNDHELMWSHYADAGRGFVLALDGAHPFFDQRVNPDDHLRCVMPVAYTDIRPQLSLLNPEVHIEEFAKDVVQAIFFTKSLSWEYEDEWRMILPKEAVEEIVRTQEQEVWLKRIPPGAVNGVIFGSRCLADARARGIQFLENGPYSKVQIKCAQEDPNDFRVNIVDM